MTRKVTNADLSPYLRGVPSLPADIRALGMRDELDEADAARFTHAIDERRKMILERRRLYQRRFGPVYIEPPTLPE